MPEPATVWTPTFLVVTCEHGGNDIPESHASRFAGDEARAALASHRGHDPGALEVARPLAELLRAPLFHSTVSRLLVDLNRSRDHAELFSPFMRDLDDAEREEIIAQHYEPHRARVEQALDAATRAGARALHVGMHTFVDELNGVLRRVDLGLLFDPSRSSEATLCAAWAERLRAARPDLRVRFNEPYLGVDDGFATALRGRFDAAAYAGVEIEARQGLVRDEGAPAVAAWLGGALTAVVAARNDPEPDDGLRGDAD